MVSDINTRCALMPATSERSREPSLLDQPSLLDLRNSFHTIGQKTMERAHWCYHLLLQRTESPTSPPDGHVNVHDLMKLMSAFDKEVQDSTATHYLVRHPIRSPNRQCHSLALQPLP